jgi:hypothetical protein
MKKLDHVNSVLSLVSERLAVFVRPAEIEDATKLINLNIAFRYTFLYACKRISF